MRGGGRIHVSESGSLEGGHIREGTRGLDQQGEGVVRVREGMGTRAGMRVTEDMNVKEGMRATEDTRTTEDHMRATEVKGVKNGMGARET